MKRPIGLYLLGGCTAVCLAYDAAVLLRGRGHETISVQFREAAEHEPLLSTVVGVLAAHLCGLVVRTDAIHGEALQRFARRAA